MGSEGLINGPPGFDPWGRHLLSVTLAAARQSLIPTLPAVTLELPAPALV